MARYVSRQPMSYSECKELHLRASGPDLDKVESLLKISKARIKAIKQIKKDKETSTIIAEGYYEAIKELLVALLQKNGLHSDNHECLIAFFRMKYPSYSYEADVIHELKGIRNRINYEGVFVPEPYLIQRELEFEHIIRLVREEIAKE